MPLNRELSEDAKKEIRESSDEFFFEMRKKNFPNALIGIAEGDSWFDYAPSWLEDPIQGDLINQLNISRKLNILRVAKAGDTLENMIYGTRFDKSYLPEKSQFEKTTELVRKHKPKFLLFSGGGNDVAGAELEAFLNHASSGLEPLRVNHLDYILGEVFTKIFEVLITKTSNAAPGIQIFLHGYGYTIPDGRAVARVADFDFIGPWLRPAFAKKRIDQLTKAREIIRVIIDEFNNMLAVLASRHNNVHYIDLRPIIQDQDWANELHLTVKGYEKVAQEFTRQINEVYGL